jgi:hypothetical protein
MEEKVKILYGLLTDHRPYDLVPNGVCPFSLGLLLYFLTMFPGEVEIELSPGVLEDFFSKFDKDITQKSLLLLGPQLLDLLFDLFNGHVLSPPRPYCIAPTPFHNYIKTKRESHMSPGTN